MKSNSNRPRLKSGLKCYLSEIFKIVTNSVLFFLLNIGYAVSWMSQMTGSPTLKEYE